METDPSGNFSVKDVGNFFDNFLPNNKAGWISFGLNLFFSLYMGPVLSIVGKVTSMKTMMTLSTGSSLLLNLVEMSKFGYSHSRLVHYGVSVLTDVLVSTIIGRKVIKFNLRRRPILNQNVSFERILTKEELIKNIPKVEIKNFMKDQNKKNINIFSNMITNEERSINEIYNLIKNKKRKNLSNIYFFKNHPGYYLDQESLDNLIKYGFKCPFGCQRYNHNLTQMNFMSELLLVSSK
jgi:hypothetical protein